MGSRWQYTGSSVSGEWYGYEIMKREDGASAVLLRLGSFFAPIALTLIPAASYADAEAHGQRFCHACNCWRIVKERTRLLNAGFCLVGG